MYRATKPARAEGACVIGSLQCVALDCSNVRQLASFYAELLGGEVNQADSRWTTDADWATVHAPTGEILAFQRVANHQPPAWPDPARPQQFHLDIGVADLDAAEKEVLALGAVLLEAGDGARGWRVYADPAGHPFCLVRE
jgi:catechol 2,3-dioxygenase-like lactoylglutathione lyase family enzyme